MTKVHFTQTRYCYLEIAPQEAQLPTDRLLGVLEDYRMDWAEARRSLVIDSIEPPPPVKAVMEGTTENIAGLLWLRDFMRSKVSNPLVEERHTALDMVLGMLSSMGVDPEQPR